MTSIPSLLLPPDPLRNELPSRTANMPHPIIQSLRNPHQQPTEKEQCQERKTHDPSKSVPVILHCVDTHQIADLDREVAGH